MMKRNENKMHEMHECNMPASHSCCVACARSGTNIYACLYSQHGSRHGSRRGSRHGTERNGTARHRAQHSTARRFIPTGEAEKMELESGESGDLEACRALRAHCARARACRRTYLNLQQCQLMRSSHESAHAMKSHLAC